MTKTFTKRVRSFADTLTETIGRIQFVEQDADATGPMIVEFNSYIHDEMAGGRIKSLTISDTETPGSIKGSPWKAKRVRNIWFVTFTFRVEESDYDITAVDVTIESKTTPSLEDVMYLSWTTDRLDNR
jgi:hypothetical protein